MPGQPLEDVGWPALNAVETLFSALTRRRFKRASFRSIFDLQAAINRYVHQHKDAR